MTGLTLLTLLTFRNRDLLFNPVWEDGDFAVNSILIDKARHLELLVGNYSRVGFNHPGPAFLYVQGWSELLFRDLVSVFASPFGAHLFGVLVLNSILCGLGAEIAVRRTGRVFAAPVLIACVLLYTWLIPPFLVSTWMPDVYVSPFILLLLSAASVVTLELRDAWKLILSCGLLVHGHVSFVLVAVGIMSVVIAALWIQRRALPAETIRRTAVTSAIIAALFVAPILANTILHFPGEVDDYWRYSRSEDAGGHSVGAVLAFVGDYWASGRSGHVLALSLVLAAVLACTRYRGVGRGFLFGLMGFTILASLLTAIYAMRGVDDLAFTYIARFYYAAPILTIFTIIMAAIDAVGRVAARRALVAAVTFVLAFLASRPALENPYRGSSWVPVAVARLQELPSDSLAFRFDLDYWPEAAGLVEEARRRAEQVCVEPRAPIYATLFTDDLMCGANRSSESIEIEIGSTANPGSRVLYVGPNFVLATPVNISRPDHHSLPRVESPIRA